MKFYRLIGVAFALFALLIPAFAGAQSVQGPVTFTFNAASQGNVWACTHGQSSFALTIPSGLTGTFTVTVSQTQGGTYINPPWAYAPGTTTYTNTITNSGSLTVSLGSNAYVQVADTSYTSGSVTVTGVCSSAVALIPPQPNPAVTGSAPVIASTMSGTTTVSVSTYASASPNVLLLQPTSSPSPQPGNWAITGTAYLNGNLYNNLTAGNCVKANATDAHLQSASFPCFNPGAANTFTADQTLNSNLINQVNGVGSGLDHGIKINNVAGSKPDSADSIGAIYAYAPSINSGCSSGQAVSELWPGISGHTSGNYGGYWVFWTKTDGACGGWEALVLTPGGHMYPAGASIGAGSTTGCIGNDNQGICQITTSASCTAFVDCGTVTINFGVPYYQPDGVTAELPYCFFNVQDTNLATNAWMAHNESSPSTAYSTLVIGYVPLVAQAVSRTLNIYWRCNASSY